MGPILKTHKGALAASLALFEPFLYTVENNNKKKKKRTRGCACIHLPHKPGVRAFIQLTGQLFLTCKRAKLFPLQDKTQGSAVTH